jgi:hypothetical protein
MSWLLFLKLAVIVIFLIMFLKRPSVTWGIGLLTITSAVLLDALLGTFNEEELRAELGFFYYVIAGVLFGGAAIWLWGTLLPFISPIQGSPTSSSSKETTFQSNRVDQIDDLENTVTDGQMLYQEIRERFGREDILDLMFDLNINENDVMAVDQNLNTLINNIIEITPPPPDHLPRLERISADSPPTILRQYLMTHYRLHELEQMAIDLGIDWEQLDAGAKKEKVRSLLQYLYRRNRVGELVDLMHDIGRVEGTKA